VEPRPVELARIASQVDRPAAALRALATLNTELDVLEGILVENALAAGWTWKRIGEALGGSKQAAHKKHARRRRRGSDEAPGARILVTGEARQAVYLARLEARALGRAAVDGSGLLLGLLRQEASVAASTLASLGVTPAALREQVRTRHRAGGRRALADGPVAIAPEARSALEQSLHEAVRLGEMRLGAEHLLLALLRDERGSAAEALAALGVSAEAVEKGLMRARAAAR
jgi:hypothetical protein